MPTYIVLGQFTDQGIRNVKETTKRAEAFKAMAKKAGATVKEVYWTLGPSTWRPSSKPRMMSLRPRSS
jgi:uncharacterized protein with GYD domain